MVNIINKSIFQGIAGRRPTEKPKYYILHNDAGSMSPESYIDWLQSRYDNDESDKGFAHYYINRDTIARVEDTYNGSWSTANYDGNMNSIGYEVCQQFGTTDAEFLANENMVLRQMAEDMTYYEDTPNYSNIKFHNEFSSTSCPARSLALHGGTNNSLRDYVIAKIKHYQSIGSTVQDMLEDTTITEGWKKNSTGWWYQYADGSYPKNKWSKINDVWYYFDGSGYMYANKWLKHTDGSWYYLADNGAMVENGWKKINSKWYYFLKGGAMKTGWLKDNDKWYYLDANNGDMKIDHMVKGADGWYYLDKDGVMVTGGTFTVNNNGVVKLHKGENND
jgi:N-acetylmuramoyl-L-alanine amidase|nr:MAG TPA: Endolysin [Caudoviricetes sp.]